MAFLGLQSKWQNQDLDLDSFGFKAESEGLGKSERIAGFDNCWYRVVVLSQGVVSPPGAVRQCLEIFSAIL